MDGLTRHEQLMGAGLVWRLAGEHQAPFSEVRAGDDDAVFLDSKHVLFVLRQASYIQVLATAYAAAAKVLPAAISNDHAAAPSDGEEFVSGSEDESGLVVELVIRWIFE